MQVYAIRKRRGQWAVCSEENVLLQFETYDEAVDVARAAADVLASLRVSAPAATPSPQSTPKTGVNVLLPGDGSPAVNQGKSGEGSRAA
jgi:hypothetical protein